MVFRFLGFLFQGLLVLDLLVYWCLVSWFLVSRFGSFLVSWFQSFKHPWILLKDIWYHITEMPISCFSEDIGLISKIFKILLDGSSGFVGAHLFEHSQTKTYMDTCVYIYIYIHIYLFPNFEIYKSSIFWTMFQGFLDLL